MTFPNLIAKTNLKTITCKIIEQEGRKNKSKMIIVYSAWRATSRNHTMYLVDNYY